MMHGTYHIRRVHLRAKENAKNSDSCALAQDTFTIKIRKRKSSLRLHIISAFFVIGARRALVIQNTKLPRIVIFSLM